MSVTLDPTHTAGFAAAPVGTHLTERLPEQPVDETPSLEEGFFTVKDLSIHSLKELTTKPLLVIGVKSLQKGTYRNLPKIPKIKEKDLNQSDSERAFLPLQEVKATTRYLTKYELLRRAFEAFALVHQNTRESSYSDGKSDTTSDGESDTTLDQVEQKTPTLSDQIS